MYERQDWTKGQGEAVDVLFLICRVTEMHELASPLGVGWRIYAIVSMTRLDAQAEAAGTIQYIGTEFGVIVGS